MRLDILLMSLKRPDSTQEWLCQAQIGFRGSRLGFGEEAIMAAPTPRHQRTVRTNMAAHTSAVRNDYRCSLERNQAGKYCVRIQVRYPGHDWTLGVFFVASAFAGSLKKIAEGW